jgi:hypothetical protein
MSRNIFYFVTLKTWPPNLKIVASFGTVGRNSVDAYVVTVRDVPFVILGRDGRGQQRADLPRSTGDTEVGGGTSLVDVVLFVKMAFIFICGMCFGFVCFLIRVMFQ